MSRKVTKIPQIQQDTPIEARQLRVAAYCRVSTRHEEQYHSLEAQISYYTNYIQRNPNWKIRCCIFRHCFRHPHCQPPRLSEAHERLHQKKGRLDTGKVPKPF